MHNTSTTVSQVGTKFYDTTSLTEHTYFLEEVCAYRAEITAYIAPSIAYLDATSEMLVAT